MLRHTSILALLLALAAAGCNVEVGFDPASLFQPIDSAINDFEQGVADALADPLSAKPFPVLIGGDDQRVWYATNLGDVRLNFPGPTNDLVISGFQGPSNLYKFEDKRRELVQPLLPGSAFYGMSTDGRFIAYVAYDPLKDDGGLFVRDTWTQETRLIQHLSFAENLALLTRPNVSNGRLAFGIGAYGPGLQSIIVEDLTGLDPTLEIEVQQLASVDLRGNRLAYIAASQVHLRDLVAGTDEVIDASAHADLGDLYLTPNTVVWSDAPFESPTRVYSFDIPSGELRIWADAVAGWLRGADDNFFATEESITSDNGATRIVIRRYSFDGQARKIADFRADGLAGQTSVLGSRLAWVNADRRIVLMPLEGGDRISFRPFD